MKTKEIIIAIVVIVAVVGAIYYFKVYRGGGQGVEDKAVQTGEQAQGVNAGNGLGGDMPKEYYQKKLEDMQTKEMAGIPREIALKRLVHARNVYLADPSMTPDERALYIKKIEEVYKGSYNENLPPETPEDKKEQEMIRAKTVEFKNSVMALKNDNSMTREQKELELTELLKKYIADVDKGMSEEDLKAEVEKLKADKSMSREEKEKKLTGSVGKFVETNKDKK